MKAQMLKTRFYYTLLNTKIILPFGTFLTNNCFIKKVTSCPSFRSKIHCTINNIQTFEHKRTHSILHGLYGVYIQILRTMRQRRPNC